jgi:tetratricopeptide (TPR) repeat protein
MSEVEAASRAAIDLDRENAEALAIYAHTCAWKKNLDRAVDFFDRALRLNPNLAFAWWLSAATYCYIGDPNEALRRLTRSRELAPLDPNSTFYENIYSIAYILKGDYEQAALIGRNAVKLNPNFPAAYKPLIAALGHLGRAEEAKPYIARLLALEPNFTVEGFDKVYPIKNAKDRERYMKGLRLAGVPER